MVLFQINSEYYQQIAPNSLSELKEKAENQLFKNMHCFLFKKEFRPNSPIYYLDKQKVNFKEVSYSPAFILTLSNEDVYNLLKKSLSIVEQTEEYAEYQINKLFNQSPYKHYTGIPPGTLRFYSSDHICFYTGKNWRKLDKKYASI